VETTAAFRLAGNAALTAAGVTLRLGIQPTRAIEAGDRVSGRSAAIHQESLWILPSGHRIETGTELAEHLRRLLAILEPATAALWELAQAGYEANWLCYIASHATEHAAELDRQTIQRVLASLVTCGSTSVATIQTAKAATSRFNGWRTSRKGG
jgi:hypothetical protein